MLEVELMHDSVGDEVVFGEKGGKGGETEGEVAGGIGGGGGWG